MRQLVMAAEPDFNKLAQIHKAVNFAREASFAMEALKNNDFLAKVAMADQDSLKRAVLNVAAVGLSLSPVFKHAYLVPRKGKVCLDISYRGYIHLAIDIGSIKWAHAEIVCESDEFGLRGLGEEPLHNFKPFSERGDIIGAYCVAKTHDGDYLTCVMKIDEIYSIRDRSDSWKGYKQNGTQTPWKSDESEMIKKTVIKRAYKGWPHADTRARLDEAIDVSSEADPVDFASAPVSQAIAIESGTKKIRALLSELDRTEEKFMAHAVRMFNRDVKVLEELTDQETTQAIIFLESLVSNKKSKETKVNENAG